ncbi:MAG TPA: FAD binding domain-containing protein [Chloroflexia bacterium]|nr:FAD binding domain-containing protein [Chloroflexia bacterium]
MRNFGYVRAPSPGEAIKALAGGDGDARVLAGGTDLIPLAKDDIVSPDLLVDISGWSDGTGITQGEGNLTVGALTPLSVIAEDVMVRREYSALAAACRLAATPQLRNMGTIGGNLLQQTRCWYYRGPFDCWLKGGDTCYARHGENELHSIFSTSASPCVSAHPSDPAAALLALDARVRFVTSRGEEEIAVEELYALPEQSRRSFVRLSTDAVITAVLLPVRSSETHSIYVKAMPRASWGFALVGVAIVLTVNGGTITKARVALSGVSPIPVRARQVEEALQGQAVSSLESEALSKMVGAGAQPLAHNGYKVALLRGLFSEALEEVCRRF